ncbi:hypothetical protein [Curtobacterium sp. VKM Ac-2887]|uniref:hypothetical protein n=1 Tax=Curtobacterium sp. VKM Ac-2887 TaxID=2783819 RepID=UPI00188C0D6F|nr:hypothetical protein [Curtobacterium sp. VKM Ac-2887]MBF4587628.1 hypothetical protein [Curtobacterium sp. VKM Ac-2887]
MAGFWGLDADSWGNVISALTGGGAIIGGVATFFRTSKLNREARTQDAKDARDAELRAQSREALSRVLEASTEYADVTREWRRLPLEVRQAHEAADGRLPGLVQRATAAAGLVLDEPIRRALLRATSGYVLADSAYRRGDKFSKSNRFSARDNLMASIGDLAAASLREDDDGVRAAGIMITTQHNIVSKAFLGAVAKPE